MILPKRKGANKFNIVCPLQLSFAQKIKLILNA
jgi:hypothetical protein